MGVRKFENAFCISLPTSHVGFYNLKVLGYLATIHVCSPAVTLGYLRGLEIPSLKLSDMPRL